MCFFKQILTGRSRFGCNDVPCRCVEAAPRARARSPGRCPKRPGAASYRKTTLLRYSIRCSPGVLSISDSRAAIHQSFPRVCHVATLPRFFTVPMTSAATRPSPLPRKTTSTEKSMESVGIRRSIHANTCQYSLLSQSFSYGARSNVEITEWNRCKGGITWYSYGTVNNMVQLYIVLHSSTCTHNTYAHSAAHICTVHRLWLQARNPEANKDINDTSMWSMG